MASKDNEIILSTNDRQLFDNLQTANIEGIIIVNNYRKYGDDLFLTLTIQVLLAGVPFLAQKIWEYITKNPTKKTRINERPVPNDLNETVIILKQELKIHTRTTNKSEKNPG